MRKEKADPKQSNRLTESANIKSEKLFFFNEIDDVEAVLDPATRSDSSNERHRVLDFVAGKLKGLQTWQEENFWRSFYTPDYLYGRINL